MSHLRAIVMTLLIMLFTGGISAGGLYVTKEKNKYGYADESGKIVIKPQFTHAYPFENGKAKVAKGDKWGYIDTAGKNVIKIEYDNIEPFEKGIARVKKGKKYGYIKEDGSIYIKPEYEFIGSFNEDGWLWVGKGKTLKDSQKGLYHNDKLILKPYGTAVGFYIKTDSADYTDGHPVTFRDNAPVNNEIKENFCRLSSPEAPYIWMTVAKEYIWIYDLEGKFAVKNLKYKGAMGMPKDGYSILRKYSKKKDKDYYEFNYMAADGKSEKLFKKDIRQEVNLKDIYESCGPFENGNARCGTESEAYVINTKGEKVSGTYNRLSPVEGKGYISIKDSLCGVVSFNGKENVAPTYKTVLPPFGSSGILTAQNASDGKFGFIDFDGNVVVPFNFESAIAFTDGKGYVSQNGLFGVIDSKGDFIVRNRWNAILPPYIPGCDYIWVQSPETKRWSCLRISDDTLSFDRDFDGAYSFDDKSRAVVKSGEYLGAVSTDGSVILPERFGSDRAAFAALKYLDSTGKSFMTDTEAYRFNIYNNSERHKYRLSQAIKPEMWDF